MSRSTHCICVNNVRKEVESRLSLLSIRAKCEINIAHPNVLNVEFERSEDKERYLEQYPKPSNEDITKVDIYISGW